ncbi:hypothetical protein [Dolosigranulum pigrum]|uniref:hypothetical protein n=1 Tax=Dolosigranulum pigrum TaxID=29394 RepID=UPI0019190B57|nr:hypothetical protein [Dolosigranulum pigrum]QTJ54257.1 hypothetical protein FE334_00125 [Dolosigranulum pigrum]
MNLKSQFAFINARADRLRNEYEYLDGSEELIQIIKEQEFELLEKQVEINAWKKMWELKEKFNDL